MKKLLFLAAAVAGLYSCTSHKYVIEGDIQGLDRYVYMATEEGQRIDSVKAENGRFRFKGDAENPAMMSVYSADSAAHNFVVYVFLEPGKITIKGQIEDPFGIYPAGTPANDGYAAYLRKNRELMKRIHNPKLTPEQHKALEKEMADEAFKAMEKNQDNFFGAILLDKNLSVDLPAAEILNAVSKFPKPMQKRAPLLQVKSGAIDKMKTEPGQPYINIAQNDPEGNSISLRKVVEDPANKYVLVDFWASWCAPCIYEMPLLAKAYKQYHTKGFEIYGTSLDSEKEAWLKAIKENDMKWIQVGALNRFFNEASRDYGIRTIPFNVLIDCATGKFIAVNLHGKALEDKLAELLK